jgi:glycerophosphoryl diester phosphodiesterase
VRDGCQLPAAPASRAGHPPSASDTDCGRERLAALLPPVIGHRGAAGCAPENTLAGFRKAKELGCRWVEFDVRLTADSQPVLLHNSRLERTTNGRGRVSGVSLAEVRRYDAGGRLGPRFAGERVPKLEEAIALLNELGLGANVELKAARGAEAETGAVVADVLVQTWRADPAYLLISSFQHTALAAARDHAAHIARGVLFRRIPRNWLRVAERLGCATIHADHQWLRPAIAADIRRAGFPLLAYTVNNRQRARTLFNWGVTSVFSDVPHRLEGIAAGTFAQAAVAEPARAAAPQQEVIW